MAIGMLATVALIWAASSRAAFIASRCPSTDICYQLNVPEVTATTGDGDIYFQISASTAYQWVALGQGSQMAGANTFVMYTSLDGQNVTISPRLGADHVMPQQDTAAQITMLEGSGVSNGRMKANIRCSNCNLWNGGAMDFTSSTTDWIYAYKSGPTINSDDVNEVIVQHDDAAAFTWDLSSAKGGSDANPFLVGSVATTTATGLAASTVQTAFQTSGMSNGGVQQLIMNRPNARSLSEAAHENVDTAHAVVATLAFVAIYPIGAIILRVANSPSLVWVHAAIQATGYLFLIIALGLGVVLANVGAEWDNAHPVIGIILVIVLFFQPILGLLHHKLFKKYGHRTLWSYAHIWVGRIAILLGMVNGGLGLQLAGATKSAYIAYGVVTALVGIVYIAVIVRTERTHVGKS